MDDRNMHAGDVEEHIHEAVEKTVKGLDSATAKLFADEGKTLHINIFSLMRTRDSLEKIDEAREIYRQNKAPHSMAKFGVAFETPALNKPARTVDAEAEWMIKHQINSETSIDITIEIPESASYRDVKEALRFAKNSVGNLVDKRVAELHCEYLQKLTSFEEFKKALTVHKE